MEDEVPGYQAWRQGDRFESCYEVQETEVKDLILNAKLKKIFIQRIRIF